MSKSRRNGEDSIRKRSDNCWEVRVSSGLNFTTEKPISTILGHYSVSSTLDTYAHVLTDHLNQEMGLMEELYNINLMPQNLVYPVIVTAAGGSYAFQCPDFPEIQLDMPTVEAGAAATATALRDASVAMQFPPAPSSPANIPLLQGQFLLQVAL